MTLIDKKQNQDWLNSDFFDFLVDKKILLVLLKIIFCQKKNELIGLLEKSGFKAALRTTVLVANKRNRFLVHANNLHQLFISDGVYEVLRNYAPGLYFSQYATYKKFAGIPDNYKNQLIVLARICNSFELKSSDVGENIKDFIFSQKNQKSRITISEEKKEIESKKPGFFVRIISLVKSGVTHLLPNR